MMKKKIFINVFYFIIIIPFFKTDFLALDPLISSIFNGFKILSFFLAVFLLLKKNKITMNFVIFICFLFWMLISTLINQGDLNALINVILSLSVLAAITEYGVCDRVRFLNSFLICFESVIYINLFTMILYPQGMYSTGSELTGIATQNWFLGFKNILVSYFLPGFIISYIYMNLTGKKIRTILLSICILLSAVLCGSSTTFIGIGVLGLFIVFPRLRNKTKIFNLKNYVFITVLLFFGIVIFRWQNLFEFLIVDILKKDLTLTNRTFLWDVTLNYFKNHLILGNGWQSIAIRHSMYNTKTIITAHNQILEYIYIGGVVQIILYFLLFKKVIKNYKKYKGDKNFQIISLGFFVLQILNISEVFLNPLIYMVIFLTMYAPKFIVERRGEMNE